MSDSLSCVQKHEEVTKYEKHSLTAVEKWAKL